MLANYEKGLFMNHLLDFIPILNIFFAVAEGEQSKLKYKKLALYNVIVAVWYAVVVLSVL